MKRMTSSDEEPKRLSDLFDDAWSKYRSVDESELPTVSQEFQKCVKDCLKLLITCANMVKMLSLFSSNETIDEVSTPSLRYFLISAFLGDLFQKISCEDRVKGLRTSLSYHRDFLSLCLDYEIIKQDISKYLEWKDTNGPPPNTNRDEKIRRFKENKELIEKIQIIQNRLKKSDDSVDESLLRTHYMNWILFYVNNTLDNIKSTQDEIHLLEGMKNMDMKKSEMKEEKSRPPMKPIVITRDMLKNQVFGAGYKNLPTMSEEEYFQLELQQGKIVQDYQSGSTKPKNPEKHGESESDENSDDDIDCEEKLRKARAWDDWKDTHRRGEGNKERHG